MTPDKNFKMERYTKVMLALSTDPVEVRNHFKKMLIQAQLSHDAARRAALKNRDAGESKGGKGTKDIE